MYDNYGMERLSPKESWKLVKTYSESDLNTSKFEIINIESSTN